MWDLVIQNPVEKSTNKMSSFANALKVIYSDYDISLLHIDGCNKWSEFEICRKCTFSYLIINIVLSIHYKGLRDWKFLFHYCYCLVIMINHENGIFFILLMHFLRNFVIVTGKFCELLFWQKMTHFVRNFVITQTLNSLQSN